MLFCQGAHWNIIAQLLSIADTTIIYWFETFHAWKVFWHLKVQILYIVQGYMHVFKLDVVEDKNPRHRLVFLTASSAQRS